MMTEGGTFPFTMAITPSLVSTFPSAGDVAAGAGVSTAVTGDSIVGRALARRATHHPASATTTTAATAMASFGPSDDFFAGAGAFIAPESDSRLSAPSAVRISDMFCHRSAGFFARHLRTT